VRRISTSLTSLLRALPTIILTLGLLAAPAVAAPAVAAPASASKPAQTASSVTLIIEAGFNAYAKTSTWMPMRISLKNTGEAFEGTLVLVSEKTTEVFERFEQPVALAKGAKRDVTMYVPASASTFEVKLFVNDQVITTATPTVRQLAETDRLIVAISNPADAFNFLGDTRVPFGGRTVVAQMQAQHLPDRTAALDSVDVLLFNNVDSGALSLPQRAAIRAWVLAGGYLLFNGGSGAALSLQGFAAVVPAQPGTTLIGGSPNAFQQFMAPAALGEMPDALVLNIPSVQLQLNPNAKTVIGAPETPLVARLELGQGLIDQLAFDATLAPMRDWPGRTPLFAALFGGRVDLPSTIGAIREDALPAQTASALPAAALPSVLLVGGFLLLYVLVIGPINYIVLRRFNRLSWAWVTIPAVVVAFTLAGVLTGFRLRGNAPQIHRLNLMMGDARSSDGRSFALLGLFAPRRTEVNLEIDRDLAELVSDIRTPRTLVEGASFRVGEPGTLSNLTIGGSDVLAAYSRGESDMPPIEAKLALEFAASSSPSPYPTIRGTLRNPSSTLLKDCTLLAGKDYQALGNIEPGGTRDAIVTLFLGKPQPAMNLRSARLGRDRYYRGPYYYRGTRASRASAPISTGTATSPGTTAPPFDLVGEPVTNGLVNWREFPRNDNLTQEAEHGLVFSVLGDERIGAGVYVACWVEGVADGISASARVPGAEYTDRTLLLWRVPVQSALAEKGALLTPDVFAWSLFASGTSANFSDQGLALEAGEHLIDFSPWLDVRPSGNAISLTLTTAFENTPSSALKRTSIQIFDWDAKKFMPLADDADVLTGIDDFSGAFLSPSGNIRLKFIVQDDTVTLSDITVRAVLLE
jgi:hypothetical protein